MVLRNALLAALLLPLAADVSAGFPSLFHHPGHHVQHCRDCEVHVHICKVPGAVSQPAQQPAQQPAEQPATSPLLYSPVVQPSVGYGMPMMSMMMPMMMPCPVQQTGHQQQQAPSGCGACEARIDRLEEGVKNLSQRMDKIESILENQVEAMVGMRDALEKGNLLTAQP